MEGSYHIPCKIHDWEDRTDRFYIEYFDPIMQETIYKIVPYEYVSDWTWQNLSKHSKTHGWD